MFYDLWKIMNSEKNYLKYLQRVAKINVTESLVEIEGVSGIKYKTTFPRYLDLNTENCYALGLLFGDCCSSKQTSATFGVSNSKSNLIKFFRGQIEKSFRQKKDKIHLIIRYKKKIQQYIKKFSRQFSVNKSNIKFRINSKCKQLLYEVYIYNRPLKRCIFNLIKKLPTLNLNVSEFRAFIAGMIDADGDLRKYYIAITVGSTNEKNIILAVMKRLECLSKIHITPRKAKDCFDVRIYGKQNVSDFIFYIIPFLKTSKATAILAKGHRHPCS